MLKLKDFRFFIPILITIHFICTFFAKSMNELCFRMLLDI